MKGSPASSSASADHPGQKFCRSCPDGGAWRDLDDFYNRRCRGRTIKQSICKDCNRTYSAQRYHKNKKAERRRLKRAYLRGGRSVTPDQQRADMENKRAKRLALRLARAELLINLTAEEYGLSRRGIAGHDLDESATQAQATACKLIRSITYLHPDAIAEMLTITAGDIYVHLRATHRLTDRGYGDVSYCERLRRIERLYRWARPKVDLTVRVKPYHEYSEAQRRDGRRARPTDLPVAQQGDDLLRNVTLAVCGHFGVPISAIASETRCEKAVSQARQVIYYILRTHYGLPRSEIATLVERHISTVDHGVICARSFMNGRHERAILQALGLSERKAS